MTIKKYRISPEEYDVMEYDGNIIALIAFVGRENLIIDNFDNIRVYLKTREGIRELGETEYSYRFIVEVGIGNFMAFDDKGFELCDFEEVKGEAQ